MSIWGLADPHLGQAVGKAMDVFGPRWENHAARMADHWRATVSGDDWVLVPGDISWGLKLEEALVDLHFLADLPGKKILLKGNHDYWWTSRKKVEAVLPESMQLLQNDAVDLGEGIGLVGARGWTPPAAPHATEQDEKIYAREVARLEHSLKAAEGRFDRLIAMMHYPPLYRTAGGVDETAFVPLLREAGVCACLYGHLHAGDHRYAVDGDHEGIRYYFVAADAIDFTPVRIALPPLS